VKFALSEAEIVTNSLLRLYPSFNPMNSPTHSGNPTHGNLLVGFTTALAALFALSIAPNVVAPQNPLEQKGNPPGPGYAWVPGYYSWSATHGGHHWTWFKGHFENPPRAGAVWVAPHFEDTGSDRIYVGGYWR
jgi:hypothetical protein